MKAISRKTRVSLRNKKVALVVKVTVKTITSITIPSVLNSNLPNPKRYAKS